MRMTDRISWRSDRGDVQAGPLFAGTTITLIAVAGVIAFSFMRGQSVAHRLIVFAAVIVGFIALCGLAATGAIVGERVQARRRRTLTWAMGAVLREFMDVDQLTDEELALWRRCARHGVTVEDARQWSRDGLPYPLMVASPRLSIEQRSARALADVLASAGAWDGRDRRRLVDLIGFDMDVMGHTFPILGRWLAFPKDTITARVTSAVSHADTDTDTYLIATSSRVVAAVVSVLYDLEGEHGIEGWKQQSYFYRPARPVHPSWLAHA